MGWRRGEAEIDGDVLKLIVTLLVALAALAERAAHVSTRRRAKVLSILLWGEAEARSFVIGLATGGMAFSGAQAPSKAVALSSDAPFSSSDAAHCAVRLRALALVLCLFLAGAHAAAGPRLAPENPVAGIITPKPAALAAPDTS